VAERRRDQPLPRPRGGGGWRRLGRRLLGPVGQVARSLEPAARLLRSDAATARSWARNVAAVQEALGGDLARAYGDLLVSAAARDPAAARQLADLLPDQVARLAPELRRRFLVAVHWTLQERPHAVLPVALHLASVLGELDDDGLRAFILEAAELQRESPVKAASFLRGESDRGRLAIQAQERGTGLEQVQRVLALYAAAHCGELVTVEPAPPSSAAAGFHPLREAAGGLAHTDGHHIRLPARIERFDDERDFLLYRVLTALCVGYLEQGTFDLELRELAGSWPRRKPGELELQRMLRGLGNRSLAGDLFMILEDVRVEAAIRRAYPGLARDLDRVRADLPAPDPPLEELRPVDQLVALLASWAWTGELPPDADRRVHPRALDQARALCARLPALREPQADVQRTAALLLDAWPAAEALISAEGTPEESGSREPGRGGEAAGRGGSAPSGAADAHGEGFEPQRASSGGWGALLGRASGGLLRPQERDGAAQALDERAYAAHEGALEAGEESTFSDQRARILAASRQRADYTEADAWLSAMEGPSGALVEERPGASAPLPPSLSADVEPQALEAMEGATYPEWDVTIGDYRPSWVLVRELPLQRASGDFVERVNASYRPQILSLRRQFEALRPSELQIVRGLSHGDAMDLDRVVEALTVRRAGGSPSDRLYLRHERSRRDVAVAFLLDMSSSTNEVVSGGGKRIIEVEKEALVIIAEAVDAIGDRFAVWGFSGYGRDQVAFYEAKGFEEPWDRAARERIGAMSWKMENRDGAAIRHATALLLRQPARIRLLILLSDGKPLDCGCDHYADAYAQEDTRKALTEARKAGLHPFCITVDPHSRDYLQRMYGAGSYTIIDRVESLPLRIPAIYRRLTR
jgi:nitric oxide reductase NorD protein